MTQYQCHVTRYIWGEMPEQAVRLMEWIYTAVIWVVGRGDSFLILCNFRPSSCLRNWTGKYLRKIKLRQLQLAQRRARTFLRNWFGDSKKCDQSWTKSVTWKVLGWNGNGSLIFMIMRFLGGSREYFCTIKFHPLITIFFRCWHETITNKHF